MTSPIVSIIVVLISLLAGYAVSQLKQAGSKVEANIPANWLPIAQEAARIAVRAAYQLFDLGDPGENKQKLDYCMEFVNDWLLRAGIELSDADLNTIRACIEAAWIDFKNTLPTAR